MPGGQPYLAIVDGYSTGAQLSKALADAGAVLFHVRSAPEMAPFFTGSFRPADYKADLGYVAGIGQLATLLGRHGVDRVVAGTESGVILADTLNARMGLPGNAMQNVRARRDKAAMAATAAAAGLAVPFGRRFTDAAAAVEWYAGTGLRDAVVKPVSSAGSDNVWFCDGPAALRAAAGKVLSTANLYGEANRSVLVQERLRGTEYYLNTVSARGVHRVAEMWRYTKSVSAAGAPLYDFEEPVPPGSARADMLRMFVFGVLDALGISDSPAHAEIMVTERGPVLIEVGARLGGATLAAVVERYSGISQTSLFAATLLDPGFLASFDDRSVRWTAHLRNVALVNHRAGTVLSDRWRTRLASLPTVVAISCHLVPGCWLPATATLVDSPGYVYLASPASAAIEADYQAIRCWERDCLYLS